MTDVLIVGIPRQQERRLKAALRGRGPIRSGWSLEFVASARDDVVSINTTVVARVRELLSAQGRHVLAFRPADGGQQAAFVGALRPSFRMRWAENAALPLIPHRVEQFFSYLSDQLGVEEGWSADVKPLDTRSALLLPQSSFITSTAAERIWGLAAEAANAGQIQGAANAISGFRSTHWKGSGSQACWTDDVGNRFVFAQAGSRHGVAPFPRNWKFSFAIPMGFHYDVTSSFNRPFNVVDRDGHAHRGTPGGHVNLDVHGVRI